MSETSGPRDVLAPRPVVSSSTAYHGLIWDIASERVDLGDGVEVTREFVRHTGAVGILAIDEQDRVLMVSQYRHPVGYELCERRQACWTSAEPPVECAMRELAEEDLVAQRWDVLIDWFTPRWQRRGDPGLPGPGAERRARREPVRAYPRGGLDDLALVRPRRGLRGGADRPVAQSDRRGRGAGCTRRPRTRLNTLRPADSPWSQHKAFR